MFVMRKLDAGPQTLGEKLRGLRRGQAVSLEMMEKRTKIQRKYLEALEHGRYEELPEPLYTRNFIRAYIRALGSDETYFIELYEEECGRCDVVDHLRLPRQRIKRVRLFVWNHLFRFAFAGLFAGVLMTYLGWQIHGMTKPPTIMLLGPADSVVTDRAIVNVEGLIDSEATVYVNGQQVVVNADYTFLTTVDLEQGFNTIVVEAERRYSRRAVVERRIVFNPEQLGRRD